MVDPEASAYGIRNDPTSQRQKSYEGENPCTPDQCIDGLRVSRPNVMASHVE